MKQKNTVVSKESKKDAIAETKRNLMEALEMQKIAGLISEDEYVEEMEKAEEQFVAQEQDGKQQQGIGYKFVVRTADVGSSGSVAELTLDEILEDSFVFDYKVTHGRDSRAANMGYHRSNRYNTYNTSNTESGLTSLNKSEVYASKYSPRIVIGGQTFFIDPSKIEKLKEIDAANGFEYTGRASN
jgi:hypothetical protein